MEEKSKIRVCGGLKVTEVVSSQESWDEGGRKG